MYMDIEKVYRHLRQKLAMRDWFLFKYDGRYYQCVSLPFGWRRSPEWFTDLICPLAQENFRCSLRILKYLDEFMIEPSPYGVVSTIEN